jgi:GTP-binding protein
VKTRRFVDSILLHATAGNGGNGSASFRREKFVPKGGPDGGDGGRGGHIILRANNDTDSLIDIYFSPQRRAEHGGCGSGSQSHGRNGRDLIIPVPCGTQVLDAETGQIIGDLVEHNTELIVAKGGQGGRGNVHWKRSTHQAPTEHTDGTAGEILTLRLELKIVADIGLVGLPNAGKSSLLRTLSDAHPKVAAYPFTTLHPIIGTMIFDDYSTLKVADIPGLIKGAHDGTGLGHDFLRHIERSSCLLYVIDMAGVDGRAPTDDFKCLRKELELYQPELLDREWLVVANKMDLPEAAAHLKTFTRKTGVKPLKISTLTGAGVPELKALLHEKWGAIKHTGFTPTPTAPPPQNKNGI